MKEDIQHSDKAPKPVGLYPHARKVGNLLFLSGIGSREREGDNIPGAEFDESGKVVSYSIEQQCHSVFKNVRHVLEDAGARWEDLVDVTVFLTNMDDFEVYNKVYAEYFRDVMPCRTTVGVDSLPTQIAIELKCIAVLNSE
jgi:2-aminomuconate deaminase